MKQYVYQLSLRKPDDKKQQFIIESDTMITNERITEEKMQQISQDNKCDIMIQFIGFLISKKKPEALMKFTYHTEQMIEDKLNEWYQNKKEVKYEDINKKSI